MLNQDRAYVICHMMSTIDGKIDSGVKGIDILGDYYELYSKTEKLLKPDAWMCGRVTAEMFTSEVGTQLSEPDESIDSSDFVSSFSEKNFFVAIDTKGLLRWENDILTFGDGSMHQIIHVVTEETPKNFLSYLKKKNISYIFGGKSEVNFSLVFKKLKELFDVKVCVLEGGGLINGSVIEQDLVDEISLLVTPIVLNRTNAPVVFERNTEELNLHKFNLQSVEKFDNSSVWLRYKKI